MKEAFDVESKYEAFYTNGNIEWSKDGEYMFCQTRGILSVVAVKKGTIQIQLGKPESDNDTQDYINTFAVDSINNTIVTHHKSSLFKLWNWQDGKILKVWKSIHEGPVPCIDLKNGHLMASGSSNSTVRLWDLNHHACIHKLKGLQGVVSVLSFHPNSQKELVFAAGDDTAIHGWNTTNGHHYCKLKGHFSTVTSLSFHEDGVHLVSSGRDKVIILHDIIKCESLRTIPTYESIEGLFIVPSSAPLIEAVKRKPHDIYVAAAGEKGVVNIYNVKTGQQLYSQDNSLLLTTNKDARTVTHLLYNEQHNNFAMVSQDDYIIIHSLETFACIKQLIGSNEEINDIVFMGDSDSHLAIATNSFEIKLYELSTMNCRLLNGHTNVVLSLSSSPANKCLLVSSDKDCTVRVWLMDKKTSVMSCIGVATRHTKAVGSISLSPLTATFFVTTSDDLCLKTWDLPEKLDEQLTLNVSNTIAAHDKDINCVTVSPNEKLIATGSQDKTAKLWSVGNLQLLGVFRGHRRGVMCVKFSPVDQVLLTTSADCTIKIWSLTELNCLKTMEGHEASVVNAEFLSRGMQVITTGGDGLLKLWNMKTSECVTTLDKHEDRVWAIAVNKEETHIVSGGCDSLLIIWRDVTEERKQQAIKERDELALQEQKLANLLQAKELTAALTIALKLERPLQTLKIVEGIIKRGEDELRNTIRELKPFRQEQLLKCTTVWNTNSRNAQAAQLVINALLREVDITQLRAMGLTSSLEAMIPYTDRHFKRLTRLVQDLHILNYTLNRMKPESAPSNERTEEMEIS